ncbi:hypothetical protein SLEP1_g6583 [Rubroshorea leprosula]|nr:hypothetical protein SLEP1_g6583 [Rubroshorea leprosula]
MDDKVSAFIDVNTGYWKEGDVRQQFCAENAESILHIPLSKRCSVDRLIWLGTNNGKVLVKSAYKYAWELIFGTQHHAHDQILKPVWRAFWSLNVPSKLKHVLWRIIWEILPSRDILQSRGLEIKHECGICGVIKINVDASIPPQSGTASLGVVLRDCNGGVLGAGKKTISFQGSVNHAEVLAISFGVHLKKEFGCKNVVVESDSKNAVQAAASLEECFLIYGAVVEEIQERTRLFDSCSFKFARRALNETAHRIAHMHSPLPPWEGVWVGTLPSAIGIDLVS